MASNLDNIKKMLKNKEFQKSLEISRANLDKSVMLNIEARRGKQEKQEPGIIGSFTSEDVKRKRGRPKKVVEEVKPKNIMKGRADLIGNRVEANMNVKKGLKNNEKRALKHAVIEDLDKKIKMSGRSIRRIYLSDTESDSDSEKEEELKKVYKHLKSHMKDKKEKRDPIDEKQAKEIKKILSRK